MFRDNHNNSFLIFQKFKSQFTSFRFESVKALCPRYQLPEFCVFCVCVETFVDCGEFREQLIFLFEFSNENWL